MSDSTAILPVPAPNDAPPADSPSMTQLVHAFDWASTSLGPIHSWPASLRIAVNICLNSRFPMFVWWGNSLINIYNDAYIPVLGKRHPHALGQPAQQIWSEIWPVIGPQTEAVMLRGEATWNERVHLVMERNGYSENAYFTWSYSPIHDEHNKIVGLFCACSEDTPQVLAEAHRDRLLADLSRERAQLSSIFAQSPAFLALLRGPSFVYEFANDRYFQVVGRRDILNKPIREALPELAGQGFIEILDQVYNTGQPFTGQNFPVQLQRNPAGALEKLYVDFVYQPMRDSNDAVTGILVHGIDVTARQHADLALRQSEERFRAAFEQTVVGIVLSDLEGAVLRANSAFCSMVGYSLGELLYRNSTDYTHPDDINLNRNLIASVATGELPSAVYQKRYVRKDRNIITAQISLTSIRDAVGKPVGLIVIVEDITERNRVALEREALLSREQSARAEMERANAAKDEFLAVLSHELRTPLTPVLTTIQLMEADESLPPNLREQATMIRRNVELEARLIDDLLDLTKVSRGKIQLQVRTVDIHEKIKNVANICSADITAKNIQLLINLDARFHHHKADPARIQQIIWNLLKNAVKFTPAGGRIVIATTNPHGGHIRITVTDNGIGIEPARIPHVFDAFEQGGKQITRQFGGLGLGLAISKTLVQMHNGNISVESPGSNLGATFTVEFPTTNPANVATDHPTPTPTPHLTCYILLVEDHPDTRRTMTRLLSALGCRVTAVGTIAEAVTYANSQKFDLIISDIGLPDGSGIDLLQQILPSQKPLAIALSGYGMDEDIQKSLNAGFHAHLTKPIDIQTLEQTIRRVLSPQ